MKQLPPSYHGFTREQYLQVGWTDELLQEYNIVPVKIQGSKLISHDQINIILQWYTIVLDLYSHHMTDNDHNIANLLSEYLK